MQTLWQDVRYGLRGIWNRPGFAILAILTLALGMGSTTTIFSAIQNILLDPFPYTDARRVAAIQIHDLSSARPGGRGAFQVPEFLDYQEQNHVFEEVIGGTGEDVLHVDERRHRALRRRHSHGEHVHVPGRSARSRTRHHAGRRQPHAPLRCS